ncbi:MAG: pectate lyase [Clostridiales bacterium]|nr:pectate lyase [Clostridiales bacterium]
MKRLLKRAVCGVLSCVFLFGGETAVFAGENYSLNGLDKSVISDLNRLGAITENPQGVRYSSVVSEENVSVSSVETYGGKYVVVTFDGRFEESDPSDITLKKYSDNWYELKPELSDIEVLNSFSALNSLGESVFIYEINEEIDGVRVVPDRSGENFDDLQAAVTLADNYLSWQMDHGGWDKAVESQAAERWNGTDPKNKFSGWSSIEGEPIGTIDNSSTYTQMRQIAAVYREVKDDKYKESIEKGLDFIFKLQYESGGLAQVYPRRGNYSDYVTFNDNAMINTLIMLEDMEEGAYPFDSDIISAEYRAKIEECLDKATDYILKAQIVSQGVPTAWCAQHDPVTYEPRGGRAYELPSISGQESINIIKFLMNRKEQTEEIKYAVDCAVEWYKKSEVKGYKYVKKDPENVYFVEDPDSSMWYRFYEINTNRPIFSDRDGIVKYNLLEVGEERRNGYTWAGSWGKNIIEIYDSLGYYPNRIEAVVTGTGSKTAEGKTLSSGAQTSAGAELKFEGGSEILRGDVDNNGVRSWNDGAALLDYVVNDEKINPRWITSGEVSDADGDGEITAADTAMILAKILDGSYEY